MKITVINQNEKVMLEIKGVKTIKGAIGALKRSSFAIPENWKIRIESTVSEAKL